MRSDDPKPAVPSAWPRLRAGLAPARRWLAGQGPGPRLALILAPLALLGAAAYYLGADEPVATAWLYGGHRFAAEDASKVAQVLKAGRINVVVDEGKVGVPPGREADALAALGKAKLAPRSAGEIFEEAPESSLIDGPEEKRSKADRQRDQYLGRMICELDEAMIESAIVKVTRPRPRPFGPPEEATAIVRISTQGDRPPTSRVVEKIQAVLMAWEHLKPDAVTVFDRRGTIYLAPGTPAHLVHSQARADELRAKILEELDWIKGIRVSVRIDREPPGLAPAGHRPAAVVIPNAPASLPPEDAPDAAWTDEPAPAPADAPWAAARAGRAKVLVQVPLSFYRHHQADDARHELTPAELQVIAEKTEGRIRLVVEHVVPRGELGGVDVVRIDPPAPAPAPVTAFVEPRRFDPGWAPAVGVFVLVAAVGVVGVMAGRRPSAGPDRGRRDEVRHREDGPGARPAPSERVRELVRRDPVAAAGVLQRWIGQGGDPT